MLQLSRQIDYALVFLGELAQTTSPVSLSSLAKTRNLPLKFLEQIAAKLKAADIITAKSGPTGGHILSHPPHQISLNQVVSALEGEWHLTSCLATGNCFAPTPCSHRPIIKKAEALLRHTFSHYTLADLTPTKISSVS